MNLPAVAGAAYARADWGRWVVDCPACPSALALDPCWPEFRCWDCGAEADIVWPANYADIETVLMLRPDVKTRNWRPGEHLLDLLAENLAHGVLPPEWAVGRDNAVLLAVVGDRIVAGSLPGRRQPEQIGAGAWPGRHH